MILNIFLNQIEQLSRDRRPRPLIISPSEDGNRIILLLLEEAVVVAG